MTTAALMLVFCLWLLTPNQVLATTYPISFGECEILVNQPDTIRIDRCVNTSNKVVNDLHLIITSRDLPMRQIKITSNYPSCYLPGGEICFGPAVPPGGAWEGIDGSVGNAANVTIWDLLALGIAGGVPNPATTRVAGFWTIDGEPVVVPSPASPLLLGGAIAALGALGRRRAVRSCAPA